MMAFWWVATDAAIGQTSCGNEPLPTTGCRLAAQFDCTAQLVPEAATLFEHACNTTCRYLMTAAVEQECRHAAKWRRE